MKTIHLRWGLAATVLLGAGLYAGAHLSRPTQDPAPVAAESPAPETRPAFALMLYEDESYEAPASDVEHAARVAEYSAWARELAARGDFVDGAELVGDGVLLHRERPRTEKLPTAAEGVLAGYFVIRAASFEDAEKIAAQCPHLAYGGSVSLRPTGA